jgi:hypothetical protein
VQKESVVYGTIFAHTHESISEHRNVSMFAEDFAQPAGLTSEFRVEVFGLRV